MATETSEAKTAETPKANSDKAAPEFPPVDRSAVMNRAIIAIVFFTVVLLVSRGLYSHVVSAVQVIPGQLTAPLESFPHELDDWTGVDTEIDENSLYADQHLQRDYTLTSEDGGPQTTARVWMVFSSIGEDRMHHPEICMAVAGQTEDKSAQAVVVLDEDRAPIQQFRFGEKNQPGQLVYYWHYTLPTERNLAANGEGELDWLQSTYHFHRQRPASLTVEVFATENSFTTGATTQELTQELLKLIDRDIQKLLPEGSKLGSDRLAVKLVDGQAPPTEKDEADGEATPNPDAE